ncbi:hypothetical protein IV02_07780 [Pseudomonas syringae]|uniref:Uncharacterized protein n=1 Tax=Pseudomonas syringae TaxID=317 RepID=A0A085VA74_PSESX|nr:hypothetical protein IV02_07780 [Pseudomonas syringae]
MRIARLRALATAAKSSNDRQLHKIGQSQQDLEQVSKNSAAIVLNETLVHHTLNLTTVAIATLEQEPHHHAELGRIR